MRKDPMTYRIHKLNDTLSNQIAAGEVIERPSSALKELLENSLDAGSTEIQIEINEGGKKLLLVSDNGKGIHPDDLLLAVERHSTSKISKTDDLFAIKTWGFRGEALASIAAVSQMQIHSRDHESTTGRFLHIEGGSVQSDQKLARNYGTTIKIENLFYNTPARLQFLKTTASETSQCLHTIYKLAMNMPHVAFHLTVDGEERLQFSAAKSIEERIHQVYKSAWNMRLEENDLLHLHTVSGDLKIDAWVLPQKFYIPSTRGIFTYVNRRSVKDKLLQQSILSAAKEVLFGNLYPQLVLNLELPPEQIDVNVHPSKAEIRFKNSSHVFAAIKKHLSAVLKEDRRTSVSIKNNFIPTLEEEFFARELSDHTETPSLFSVPQNKNLMMIDSFENRIETNACQADLNTLSVDKPYFLGTLKNTYLICQVKDGLLLIDQHAAHERITYEKLKESTLKNIQVSDLLVPIVLEIPKSDLDRFESFLGKLEPYGFSISRFGPSQLKIHSIPYLLLKKDGAPALSLSKFFQNLFCTLDPDLEEEILVEKVQNILLESLATQSCHGSVRAGQSLDKEEALELIEQMSETDYSGHCPHGRPTSVKLKWPEIERLFRRIT
ncbi:MAG: DNA mismatch repair endonuclease MutL [Oligoflexia bacterium]|nr:DNA mismatch repair endonuclease MutL [Oligoflexia bacterium]